MLDSGPPALVDSCPMGWCYRRLLRPLLFLQDSERAHNRVLRGMAWVSRGTMTADLARSLYGAPAMPVECLGLHFPNPVGLAAGMDKAAAAAPLWQRLGFGFAELGGVTRHSQTGNDMPRMFRAVADHALVNRMGFNNPGAEAMAKTLANWRAAGRWPSHPIGINLGKSKVTPLEKAPEDYARSFRVLRKHAGFFVINVSSPNTPNLRQLQDKAALDEIISALREVDSEKPLLVKVAPDLTFNAIDDVLDLAVSRKLAGIVATNTTIARPETSHSACRKIYDETGGLSGAPLRERSTDVVRHIHRQTEGGLPVIGVGGVFNAADAWEKITAGASLIQVYTGLVYEGPSIAKDIVRGLRAFMARDGIDSVADAVGIQAG